MSAILFGSISTIADTSELQREAFNRAFSAHGLDWNWDRDTYLGMLESSGGAKRIAEYAESVGATVDAKAVHESKSEFFRESLAGSGVRPRSGVIDTMKAAKDKGSKVALVTTTSPDNVGALVAALGPDITVGDFDLIVDSSTVDQPKPDRAAYSYAIRTLDETAESCVAIEDNLNGVDAAVASGLSCVAFPNENTAGHDFAKATQRVDRLDFEELQKVTRTA
ncbi:MAG: HAD-IA family hydrolase [Pseudonocardia sediminis]